MFCLFPSQQEALEAKCEPTDEVPPEGELGIFSVNSLRRSVSQVIDGKSLTGDDDAWDPNISGHDSGMVRDSESFMLNQCRATVEAFIQLLSSPLQFMEDEEFVDTIKGFSTVRKEHTMFTDTNL